MNPPEFLPPRTEGLVAIQTGDGSYTFYNTRQNIYFRSLLGARTEAEYVFLAGTRLTEKTPDWSVLELGLGPGMNFLTTATAFLKQKTGGVLRYHVVEQDPLPAEIISQLNYPQWLPSPEPLSLLKQILDPTPATRRHASSPQIELTLYPCAWQDAQLDPDLRFQAIYHDPFGPAENPESWSRECFSWENAHLAADGCLATYGAATAVRKAMVAAGLHIASRKGSGPKREMTLAAQNPLLLAGERILSREKYLK